MNSSLIVLILALFTHQFVEQYRKREINFEALFLNVLIISRYNLGTSVLLY